MGNDQMDISVRVNKESHLAFLVSAFLGAYNRRTDALAKGMNAIALALSTPQDNSSQVQAEIDKLTAQLNASTDTVEDAINQQQKGA